MKKTILTGILSFAAAGLVLAQDCKDAMYFREGRTITYTKYDKNGKPAGRDVGKIAEVKENGGVRTSVYKLVKYDAKDKVKEDGGAVVTCSGEGLKIGFQIPKMDNGEQEEAYFSYPSDMKPGQKLEANMELHIKGKTNGKKMDVYFRVENRSVIAMEKITTPTGTYTAYKIGYDMDVKFKVMGIGIPMKLKILEWYEPAVGVVKTESYNKDGKLEEQSVLSSLQ